MASEASADSSQSTQSIGRGKIICVTIETQVIWVSYGQVLISEGFSSSNMLEMKKICGETVMVNPDCLPRIIKKHPGRGLGLFLRMFLEWVS